MSGTLGMCESSTRSELLGQGWDRPPQHRALPWPVVWGSAGSASEGPRHKPQGTGGLLSCSPTAFRVSLCAEQLCTLHAGQESRRTRVRGWPSGPWSWVCSQATAAPSFHHGFTGVPYRRPPAVRLTMGARPLASSLSAAYTPSAPVQPHQLQWFPFDEHEEGSHGGCMDSCFDVQGLAQHC